jgi:predicted ATPase
VVVEVLAGLVRVGRAAPGSIPETLEHVITHLRGQRGLLILDNCEHLLASVSAIVAPLLAGCPELRILATSREPLGVAGEAQQPVQPLSLARPGTRDPRELLGSEAVRLFEDRAIKVRPDLAVTSATAAAVDEVCRHRDGSDHVRVAQRHRDRARLDDRDLGDRDRRAGDCDGRQAAPRAARFFAIREHRP